MSGERRQNAKEDDTMSAYVKPIQATPTLTGSDATNIIKEVLKAPSAAAVERNKAMLEIRKSMERK